MTSGSLFSADETERLRRERVAAAHAAARLRRDWYGRAMVHAIEHAWASASFTTDPVWAALAFEQVPRPADERLMGNVMRELMRLGAVVSSHTTRKSHRAECHGRPVTVWKSLVVGTGPNTPAKPGG